MLPVRMAGMIKLVKTLHVMSKIKVFAMKNSQPASQPNTTDYIYPYLTHVDQKLRRKWPQTVCYPIYTSDIEWRQFLVLFGLEVFLLHSWMFEHDCLDTLFWVSYMHVLYIFVFRGFPTRISCLRYTILVWKPRILYLFNAIEHVSHGKAL